MPTFKRPHQVGESIRSLLDGNFNDFELLVRDDGDGTDGTEQAVETASRGDPRVQYHRNPQNLRMPENLNSGICETSGDYIAVCHDHDLYAPDFLTEMHAALASNPSATYVHCGIQLLSQEGSPLQELVGDFPPIAKGKSWLRHMLKDLSCPVCALTMVPRKVHEKHGLYDPQHGFIADVELWKRLCLHGDVAFVKKPLILVREREADHFATHMSSELLQRNVRIHRQYIPLAYSGLQAASKQLALSAKLWNRLARNWLKNLVRKN